MFFATYFIKDLIGSLKYTYDLFDTENPLQEKLIYKNNFEYCSSYSILLNKKSLLLDVFY